MLEITLNGATMVASGVEAAELLRSVLSTQPVPAAAPVAPAPAPAPEPAPTQRTTERKPRKSASTQVKSVAKSERKAANQAAQAEITRLRKAGDHAAADAIARERGWSVATQSPATTAGARASAPVARKRTQAPAAPAPVSEPASVPEPAPVPVSVPEQAPAQKRDRTQGGTRRTNGHKFTCACKICGAMDAKAGTAPSAPDTLTQAMERPARTQDHKPARQSDKLHTPHERTSPAPVPTLPSKRERKEQEQARRVWIDECDELRSDVKDQVKSLLASADLDGLDALCTDLRAQEQEHTQAQRTANDAGDGLGAWGERELVKRLGELATYVDATLEEALEG